MPSKSFNGLVEELAAITHRAANSLLIEMCVGDVYRELQCYEKRYFNRDTVELQIAYNANSPTWDLPADFMKIRAVEYTDIYGVKYTIVPKEPGSSIISLNPAQAYYYQAGNYYAFGNIRNGSTINIAYYRRLPYLYYRGSLIPGRPAPLVTYNGETDSWVYDPSLTTPEMQAAEKDKVTNWILENYPGLVFNGALATLYAKVGGDSARTDKTYAIYSSQRPQILAEASSPA